LSSGGCKEPMVKEVLAAEIGTEVGRGSTGIDVVGGARWGAAANTSV
jgi:hypothetical protein